MAVEVYEPIPIENKPKRVQRNLPEPTPPYWLKAKPRPEYIPPWKRDGYESAEAWRAAIEKMLPAEPYVYKQPRITFVSGGLPGLGRRR